MPALVRLGNADMFFMVEFMGAIMIIFINLRFILIAALGLWGLSACGLTSSVKFTTVRGVCSSDSIESGCAAESSKLLSLTSRRPLVIKSGDTVALTGTGFNKAMSATVGGIAVTSLDVTSATSASLVVPAGVATGMSELKLALNTAEATASMAYTPANDIPLMTVAASEVCAGVAFYDINGDLQPGTRVCTVDMSNIVAGNIKTGVTIAGVAGQYPSDTYTLSGASGTADLDSATFDAKMKSATVFEWFGPDGVRYTGAGDADLSTAANIANGVTVFGMTGTLASGGSYPNVWNVRAGTNRGDGQFGKLKVNCRNSINNTYYNYDGAVASIPSTGVATGTTMDIWDTIDDYYGQPASTGFPAAWTVTNNYCGGVETDVDDDKAWKDVTTTNGTTASTCAGTSANCTMKDKISGLEWSKIQTSGTWPQAINTCDALTHNGASDWRLPTQKELMDAYNHGAISAQSTNWITTAQMQGGYFWSSSTLSNGTSNAWVVYLSNGYTDDDGRPGTGQVACVR